MWLVNGEKVYMCGCVGDESMPVSVHVCCVCVAMRECVRVPECRVHTCECGRICICEFELWVNT